MKKENFAPFYSFDKQNMENIETKVKDKETRQADLDVKATQAKLAANPKPFHFR